MSRDILSIVKLSKIVDDMNFVTTSFQKYKRKNIMKNENPIPPNSTSNNADGYLWTNG
jgi:hypothetical protein